MEKLLEIVETEKIFLSYDDININGALLGLYFFDPARNQPFIILDHSLQNDIRRHRSVLAEELGHHFTIPQTNFLVPYTSYSHSLRLGRDERRALVWACDELIPMKEFTDVVTYQGVHKIHELSEIFRVTEWLIKRRIQFAHEAGFMFPSQKQVKDV